MALETNDPNLNIKKIKEDDRLIRMKTSDYLTLLRKDLKTFESNYRQEFLPAPTREKPYPDKKVINFLAVVKKIELRIENLEVLIRGADSSFDDKAWTRHKDTNQVLKHLCSLDEDMMLSMTRFYNQLINNPIKEDTISDVDIFLNSFEQLFKKRQEYLRVQVQTVELKF